MATEMKITEPKAAEAKAAKVEPKTIYIKTVNGRMVDPHTAFEYTQTPSELLKRTGWVNSQLEAKKMELIDL